MQGCGRIVGSVWGANSSFYSESNNNKSILFCASLFSRRGHGWSHTWPTRPTPPCEGRGTLLPLLLSLLVILTEDLLLECRKATAQQDRSFRTQTCGHDRPCITSITRDENLWMYAVPVALNRRPGMKQWSSAAVQQCSSEAAAVYVIICAICFPSALYICSILE